MNMLHSLFIFTAVTFYADICGSLKVKDVFYEKNAAWCMELSKNPYFDVDQVVGKSWRIFYSWNVKLTDKCLDINFRNATYKVVNRIYHDMKDYLVYQPNWDAATLHVTMGAANHEMLLIADQGAAGSFLGVPNVARARNSIAPGRKAVPILKFFLKLLQEGSYLLMADCNIAVTSLSTRDKSPNRTEIEAVACSVPIDEGEPACVTDKKHYEDIFI